ncbi:MAG TPA: CaiB/BaiF CoA-transferase family protein, partial [Methylomirabilota bacterium]|nr:CaiB/BaiF CoA-transferase family protein [Methylomirabilota bacterium]
VLTGPFCGYLLAQLGADVIKVENPQGGDLARQLGADPELNRRLMGASFLAQNAQKRSLALDLKHPEGGRVFHALLARADVLLENFRPGVMARLGLGYEALRRSKPDLVYCAISGFGQDGPRAQDPAYDQIIQGLSGMMAVTGDERTAPLRAGYPVADTVGGLTAAFATVAALLHRMRTGEGQMVDVSLLDSAIPMLGWVLSNLLIAGVPPVPMGNDNFTASPSGAFATADGWLNVAANKQEQFEALCRVIGRPELATDARFAGREARKTNRAALNAELTAAFAARDAAAWEAALNAAGVPAGRIFSPGDAVADPQVVHRGLLRTLPVPSLGRDVSVVGPAARFSATPASIDRPPPQLGEHPDEILAEAGLGEAEVAALRASGALGRAGVVESRSTR